ncbi:PDLI2 protein, partial [Asarcornis scutulata]|nr:PDLI2 protein [Asarcornis scutulata]
MPLSVTLAGPAPWGFRITGGRDFGKPITVSKVMEQGKAAAGDLRPGDIIVSINGESAAEMLNVEAQNKIKQSPGELRLQVERLPPPSPSHTNGDSSPDRLAVRFQVRPKQLPPAQPPTQPRGRGGARAGAGLLQHPQCPLGALTTPLSPCQEPRSHHNSSPGPLLPPSPRPPSPPHPWETGREQRLPSPSPGPRSSPGPEPAMRRLEEDSEVYKMLQENRELRAAPRQSSTFRLLQEALEDEGGAGPAAPFPSRLSPSTRKPVAGVQKLHTCEKCGSSIATQAVRIQEGRYRHPACYACSDCGLNLKMRGHFWVGDELYCEKHARLRYQGAPAAP